MLYLGLVSLMLTALLHAWVGGHLAGSAFERARIVTTHGRHLTLAVLMLRVGGVVLVGAAAGLGAALAALAAYFFVLPLPAVWVIERLDVLPDREDRALEREARAAEAEFLRISRAGKG